MNAPADRTPLSFGDEARQEASLSECAQGLKGSEILRIAGQIQERLRAGDQVCNLTVGDFDSSQFPIPDELRDGVIDALRDGETNYPPSNGVLPLREAVREYVERQWGVSYPLESVLIAGGARPLLYATFRTVVNAGDAVVYPVPSWNNNHYSWLTSARAVPVATDVQDGFMPRWEQLRPHLEGAALVCLNSPLNPTGTVIEASTLTEILEGIVQENEARARAGRSRVTLLYDQVYGSLVFGDATHELPVQLVPECAPYVVVLDGVSKAFSATGLRVGWTLAPPRLTRSMSALVGHMGAWAPRPEQVALAAFLRDGDAVARYRSAMSERVTARLGALYDGFQSMKRDGYPVDCVRPQGAIYLSLQLDALGRTVDGQRLQTNEDIRALLLEKAGLAVVPFQAFGLPEDTGWFRLSVGAVSLEDIEQAFPRLRTLLRDV